MARSQVISIDCARCGKTETQQPGEVFTPPEGSVPLPECTVTFRGKSVSYDDLCKSCREAVSNMFERISKVTPETARSRKTEKKDETPASDLPASIEELPGFQSGAKKRSAGRSAS